MDDVLQPTIRAHASKRSLDLVLVLGSLPLWLPVMLFLAVIVRVALGTPILFRQLRPGLHERPFVLLKFRSMRDVMRLDGTPLPDAERLTRFGRFLRSSSLDELPELLNVLRGEMSLVGPRPLLVRYLPLYSLAHRQRHAVLPGITGLSQVSGRNTLKWRDRFDLDVEYVQQTSLSLDLRILRRTIHTVFSRQGITGAGEATMSEFVGYSDEENSHE